MSQIKAAFIGWLIELAALVAFVQAGTSEMWKSFQYPILEFAALFIGFLFYRSVQRAGWWRVVSLGGLLVFGSVLLFQVLAFTAYPGLAKDIAFASADHAVEIGKLLLLSTVIHAGLLLLGASSLMIVKRKSVQ